MSMASAAPFSGLQPAREQRALPGRPRPGDDAHGRVGREDRVDGDDPAPGIRLEGRYGGHGRRSAAPGYMTNRRRHSLVRGQVERVHHRCLQGRREPDGGRIEGVIVDHVVPDHLHGHVGGGESGLGRRGRCRCRFGRRRFGRRRFARGWPARPVERARQKPGIDSGVDHLNPGDLRSGGSVDVHLVPPSGQAAGQIGHKRLRAAELRLADGRHQRRHDRDLHRASTLKARSRGGLTPSTSKGTVRRPRRRTSSAASG